MAKALRQTKKRIPAGMPRQKLKVDGIAESKRGYWAKEEQFQELQDAGYSFVSNNDELVIGEDNYINKSSIISRPASRSDDKKLYLMEIDKNIYEENQQIKQHRINETESQIFNREDTETTYAVKGNKRTSEKLGAQHG
jgi:uncharacterized protein YbcC (UPF0753/DUF2309 family)